MTDETIIDLYWKRSERAVSATADKYGSYCRSIACNILHNSQDAEECVNDTYLGAWRSMPPQRPRRLAVYLGRITRNLSINCFKRYTAEKRGGLGASLALAELEECVPAPGGTEQALEGQALTESLERFLLSQPRQRRNIFIRRYWYMSPIREIAKDYGMSESKAASLLFRMRKELRAHLEQEELL